MHLERHYDLTYARLIRPFVGHPGRIRALRLANSALVVLMYIAYPLLLGELFYEGGLVGNGLLQKVFWVPALSFLLVTAVRRWINRLRPYEAWPLKPLIPRNKRGESLPSRHVFSSTVIAMVYLYIHPAAGVCFLLVSLASAAVRVWGGVHYPSDVAAGFLAGVGSGLTLWL